MNLQRKSDKFPPLNLNSNVLAFIRFTFKEIQNLKVDSKANDNLSVTEKQALKTLSSNTFITIKPSDKGGNIVLRTFMNKCAWTSLPTELGPGKYPFL